MFTRANHFHHVLAVTLILICGCSGFEAEPEDDVVGKEPNQPAVQNVDEKSQPAAGPAKQDKLADIVEKVEPGVVRLDVTSDLGKGIGSGFLIDKDGTVVTNYHVIAGAKTVTAQFSNGKEVPVVGHIVTRADLDIALLRLEHTPASATVLPIAEILPRKGESVYTFGSPKGLSFSVTSGTVSALRESDEFKKLMGFRPFETNVRLVQTDAAISPGNSGGPLINDDGAVVGINSFLIQSGQNLNFSIAAVELGPIIEAAQGKPSVAFNPALLPPQRPIVVPQRLDEALKTRIAAELAKHAADWRQSVETRVAKQKVEIKELQGNIRGQELLVAVVRKGGKEATNIVRRTPKTSSRASWLSWSRKYISDVEERIALAEGDIREDEELLGKGLFSPPRLQFNSLAVGKFGDVTAIGRVSQILGKNHFIAYFGDTQVHCRGFAIANLADDENFTCSMMCIVASQYSFITVTGAKRTIFSLMPVDSTILPDSYIDTMKNRKELFEARSEKKIVEWKGRVKISKGRFEKLSVYPLVETKFEPKTIIEMMQGDGLPEAPNWPRKYVITTVRRVIPRQPPSPPLVFYERQKHETDASKRWRLAQAKEFNSKKEVYVEYALDSLIRELEGWIRQPENIYNHEGQLTHDVEQLNEVAFATFGIAAKDRVQNISWKKQDKEKIIAKLGHIAIQYGLLPDDTTVAESSLPKAKLTVGQQIAKLKAKLSLKRKALAKGKTRAKGSLREVKRKILKNEVADLEKQLSDLEAEKRTTEKE